MGWHMLLIVAAGVLAADDTRTDSEKIQGMWILHSSQTGGETTLAESLRARDVRMIFDGDQLSAKDGDRTVPLGSFALDAAKAPRTYDRVYSDGSKRKGIYRIEDNKLTICIAALGKERPAAFATKPGDGLTLLVYTRAKP